MPTPFTHLLAAARLLDDEALPASARAALSAERGAFLLGNIAADARVSSNLERENTHFYLFNEPITEHPYRVMLDTYPALVGVTDAARRAFLAGYVAHLTMDEVWSLEMVRPYFAEREWAEMRVRFLMLNVLLIWMDARDYATLPLWQREALFAAQPCDWLPFITDVDLCGWRDLVARQLPPGGEPETLAIVGERVMMAESDLMALLDNPARMDDELWAHVPRDVLAEVEIHMYDAAREAVEHYWKAF